MEGNIHSLQGSIAPYFDNHLGLSYEIFNYNPGEIIFDEGESFKGFYLLDIGAVKILSPLQLLQHMVPPKNYFGYEIGVTSLCFYRYTARAARFSSVRFYPFVNPECATFEMLKDMFFQSMINEQWMRLKNKAFYPAMVEGRLAFVIHGLASSFGTYHSEGTLINIGIDQQDISQLAGTVRGNTSRIFKKWRKAGLIWTGNRQIVVKDMEQLFAVARKA